ncbi:hypothetical protein OUQ99_00480 [Streptomonospora nanhaiensis]|uniref:Uncharacterized protein n=1 Tax=Streptomonospora nanhaiensis TaxID=1323731 RepID=A0ABY6YMR5_9ACTN|nr:hypothetical protein [Streptomonospora nanhaiensis]WAE73649.1 hypothetical protein OUQ99_00480 [Streptomonospora nanhaiensis]
MQPEHQGVTVPERWDHIDELLFHGHRIQAAYAIREQFGPMPLRATIEAVSERFEHLRATRPEDFTVSLGDYWDGFYS